MHLRVPVLSLILICFALPALAGQPLIFRSKVKDVREQSVLDYLAGLRWLDQKLPFTMAGTDLNGDGVDEWIIRQDISPTCESDASCQYLVVGLTEREPVLLGDFAARKVGIADEKQYGVRNLLVYNEKNDDFAVKTYVWTPAEAAFRPQ